MNASRSEINKITLIQNLCNILYTILYLGAEKYCCPLCNTNHSTNSSAVRPYFSVCGTFLNQSVSQRIASCRKFSYCVVCLSPKSSKAHSKHEGKGCPLAQRFKCSGCDTPSCLSHNTLCCLKSDLTKRRSSDPGNSSGGGNSGGSGGHKPKGQKRRGSQQLGQKKSSDKTPSGDSHGEKQCKQMDIFGRQVEFPFQRDVQLENYAKGNGLPLNWALMPIYKMLISYLDKDSKPKSATPLTLSDSGSSCTFVSDQIMSRAQILGHWQVVKNFCN